jgi:thiosulfate reductase cytochrome b subunit
MAIGAAIRKARGRSESAALLARKHSLAVRWFHWLNFPLLFLMIWSGMLIYWANRVFTIRLFGWTIGPLFPDSWYHPVAPRWMPEGLTTTTPEGTRVLWSMDYRLAEGLGWHFTIAWLFTINGALYVLYLIFSGEWRKIVPRLSAFKEAVFVVLHDLRLSKRPLPLRKYNAAQQIAYTGVIVMGLMMVLTGIAIYKPAQQAWLTGLFGGYTVARFIHFWVTMAFVAFFVVHIAQVVRAGWNNFRGMITGHELATPEDKAELEAQ